MIHRPYFHLPRTASSHPWSMPALCSAYGLQQGGFSGGGNHVAIVELGGAASAVDMTAFCVSVGMPMPIIVNSTSPFPSDPTGADIEVALDMQVAAFVNWWCTGRVPTIEMIWDQSGTIYEGINAAAASGADTCSISWGSAVDQWSVADILALEASGWAAGKAGMAVLAASGDNDFGDGESGAHTDFPASALPVIGVSGTTKIPELETCWNNGSNEGTGGGFWPGRKRPRWQTGTPHGRPPNWGRAVADVSAVADPNTGYQIVVGGRHIVVGGTSGAAPFWAGLLAAIKAKPGFCTWQLYAKRATCFVPVTHGDNGMWPADICNGLGAPNGATIGTLLS